jgi:hypothetical protein
MELRGIDSLWEEYDDFSDAELEEFQDLIREKRKEKETAVRDKPKARLKHVDLRFDAMTKEVRSSPSAQLYSYSDTVDRSCSPSWHRGFLYGCSNRHQ